MGVGELGAWGLCHRAGLAGGSLHMCLPTCPQGPPAPSQAHGCLARESPSLVLLPLLSHPEGSPPRGGLPTPSPSLSLSWSPSTKPCGAPAGSAAPSA